jgi:hypothetical protein
MVAEQSGGHKYNDLHELAGQALSTSTSGGLDAQGNGAGRLSATLELLQVQHASLQEPAPERLCPCICPCPNPSIKSEEIGEGYAVKSRVLSSENLPSA